MSGILKLLFITPGIEETQDQCETETGWIQLWKLIISGKCIVVLSSVNIFQLLHFLYS